jgi:RNA polymerase sigma-70 factor, ECF subfamily
MSSQDNDVTRLLHRMVEGDENAAHELFPLVQAELRRLADRMMAGQDAGHTLQPTALMNEAFLRLVRQDAGAFDDREHFFAVAAKAMRSILVDHERRKRADKRTPGGERTPLSDSLAWFTPQPLDLLALDEALTKLQGEDPPAAAVVELLFFGGLTSNEAAKALGVTARTVERRWRAARAWLMRELDPSGAA